MYYACHINKIVNIYGIKRGLLRKIQPITLYMFAGFNQHCVCADTQFFTLLQVNFVLSSNLQCKRKYCKFYNKKADSQSANQPLL